MHLFENIGKIGVFEDNSNIPIFFSNRGSECEIK